MKIKLTLFLFTFLIASFLRAQGDTLRRSFLFDGQNRNYILYVPKGYDGSQKWPLVINIHGYAGNAAQQMALSNMNPVADTGRFLIVYPQGTLFRHTIPGFPPQGLGWYFGVAGDTEFFPVTPTNDVAFIRTLIDSIENKYRVDPFRIYATGWSNGGFLSSVLACELSDRIAAVAPVAATSHKSRSCNPKRKVPILYTHGTSDLFVGYENGSPSITVKGVPDYLEFWRKLFGCGEIPIIQNVANSVVSDSSTVKIITWPDCTSELIHHQIIKGGHHWPGGGDILPPPLGYRNADIVTSVEIWNFFKRNPLTPTTVSAKEIETPSSIFHKIYPNPSQGHLTIELALLQRESVRFGLYNLLGQSVAHLIVTDLPPGLQRIALDYRQSNLPPGIYNLQIHFGNRTLGKLVSFEKQP
jgi:polyhydroxybutyrate depolymerase